jgi:AcrR family transcriptional regulator
VRASIVIACWPPCRTVVSIECIATRRAELTRIAARLFAERGYHGTSMGDLAEAMGVQKGSLYSHTPSKQDLLHDTMRDGAAAFHAALDGVPEDAPAAERLRLALRAHLHVVAEQLDVATVFTREWRYLEPARRDEILAERRRYEERWRALVREGVERGELRSDLDENAAVLLALSAANWAYTWLKPGFDTDALADRFAALLVDGVRGYASP